MDNVNQSGVCTLRDAIASVNNGSYSGGCAANAVDALGSNDTIVFDSSLDGTTIGVAVADGIEITSNLVIDASSLSGGITLDANPGGSGPGSNRIFHVTGGDSLVITGVTFRNGNAGNSDDGGAIWIDSLPTHTLTLEQCAFEGNSAYTGGGAVYATYATISNSSFVDNSANGGGGAVAAFSLDARHLTLLGNTAGSSGQALYVWGSPASATLHNSIIIGSDGNGQCNIGGGGGAAFTGSHNLEGWVDASDNWQTSATSTCGASNPITVSNNTPLSDIIDSTLADNGGPTKTLKLPAGSPAIGAADPTPYTSGGTSQMLEIDFTATPPTWTWVDATLDQRGFARSAIALGRDLGAYEDRRAPPPSASDTPIPALPAPLLLMLAAAAGLLGCRRLNRNA